MPEVSMNREFLHRCCVQLSSPLEEDAAVEAETKHAIRFARAHAAAHPSELARALVWRVTDTDDTNDLDRCGAWMVLNGVLAECGEPASELSRTALADKISQYLPFLIAHRWFSTVARRDARRYTGGEASGRGRAQFDLAAFDKVVPASTINDTEFRTLDRQLVFTLTHKYRTILRSWEAIWREDVFKRYSHAVRAVRKSGNELSEVDAHYLDIPATFKDSLWRLRRSSPRPSLALHALYAYGWSPTADDATAAAAAADNNAVRQHGRRLPRTMAEIDALDAAMHPGVRKWLQQLVEAKGGCRMCDTWRHTEAHCPCEGAFIPAAITTTGTEGTTTATAGGKGPRRARWFGAHQLTRVGGQAYSYMAAVDRLYRSGLTLPLRPDEVLDHITELIMQERPYEEVLAAFDTVRGAATGPAELHALWLHASYSLLPSKTLFDKPSDDALSPSLRKAERFLRARRRLREWDQLLRCVEVLDVTFRRRALPAEAEHMLEEIRETSSFFFCLVDGSLPASYTPGKYARVPEEVVGAARLKDVLCHSCLHPFHALENCPHRKSGCDEAEHWDLQVARLVLEENNLLDLRSTGEADRYRVEEALRRIDEDDRQAKDFRKAELQLALTLLVDRRVPYCAECRIAGHSVRRCEARARRVFAQERLREIDVRLEPRGLMRRLRELRQAGDETAAGELRDAYGVLAAGTKGFPNSYIKAVLELDNAHVPLAAARYSTDAVQGFLLYINSGDLLAHLGSLRAADFPEVCLFCDSYHHTSENCADVKSEEQGFLRELRKAGVSLWHYLRNPQYYDERLPTHCTAGRSSVLQLVRQFDTEYGPGGIARQKFVEHNGLEGVAGLSPAAGASSQALSQTGLPLSNSYLGAASQGSYLMASQPLYGQGFSQLIEASRPPGGSSATTEAAAGVSAEGLRGYAGGGDCFLNGLLDDAQDADGPGLQDEGILSDGAQTSSSALPLLRKRKGKGKGKGHNTQSGDGEESNDDDENARPLKAARTEDPWQSVESSGAPAAALAVGDATD